MIQMWLITIKPLWLLSIRCHLNMKINAQQVIFNAYTCQTIQVYIKFNLLTFGRYIVTSYMITKHYITNGKK